MSATEPINSDVLTVLRAGEVRYHTFFLPTGQLPRDLYLRVNEVLSRLDGKWNRKAKGHVFPDDLDPAALIDLVLATKGDAAEEPNRVLLDPQDCLSPPPDPREVAVSPARGPGP